MNTLISVFSVIRCMMGILLLLLRWSLRRSTVPALLSLLIKMMLDTESYRKQTVSFSSFYML